MTQSLRSRLVEAGARRLHPVAWQKSHYLREAEAALDAFLDALTENTDEWAEETHVPTLVGGDALALLATLRNPE